MDDSLNDARHVAVDDRPPASGSQTTQRWLTIAADDTADYPGVVNELIGKERDGLHIKSVFKPDEVQRVLGNLTPDDPWTQQPFGSMLGMPINQLGDHPTSRDAYLDDTERCRPLYSDAFGFDPHQRVASVVEPMTGGLPCLPAAEDGRDYNPGNIRIYEGGRGGLRAHVGNEFFDTGIDGALSHLLTTTLGRNHMSYFIVLQQPRGGGALSVFDMLFTDHPTHQRRFDCEERDDGWFDQLPCVQFDPSPGDMILFGGGWRWHRVDPVVGPTPRITYGGFASPSRDGTSINFWC